MKKNRSTRKDAITLAQATAFKSALQLLTPIALVRLLDQSEFGEYRLFWLVANTAMLFLQLGVDRSLLYFLPRSTEEERQRFVNQTLVYFLGVAVLASLFLVAGGPLLPASVGTLTEPAYILTAFVFLWLASSPIQLLPNADGNIQWQARVIMVIATMRAVIVVGAALLTSDIQIVFLALLGWAALQWALLLHYVATRHGLRIRGITAESFSRQLNYALPFGVSRLFGGAARQGEQWLVAYLFSPAALAIFSIGLSFKVVLTLIRGSLGNAMLPRMSKSSAGGDMDRALQLNSRGNVAVVLLMAPAVAFIWVFGEPLVRLLYTQAYIDAVPILRIYMLTLLVMSTELATVLMVLEQGRHVAKVNFIALVVSLLTSYAGARMIGLQGVAIGALVGALVSRLLNYRHASKLLERPVSGLQDWPTLARIVAAAVVAAGLTGFAFVSFPDLPDIVTLVAAATTYTLAYAVTLWAFRLVWVVQAMADRGQWR
jgi:O-antigen/teichoic acid export membrane protein